MKFKVEMHGRGGEVVIGSISHEAYAFFEKNKIDIEDYATNSDFFDDNDEIEFPEDLMPFEPGDWYDCDSVVHASGVYVDDMIIVVKNDNDEIVLDDIDSSALKSMGGTIEIYKNVQLENRNEKFFFYGMTIEKGHFASFEIEDDQFDVKKLSIMCCKVPGGVIADEIKYGGEDAEDLDEKETYTQIEDFELRSIS